MKNNESLYYLGYLPIPGRRQSKTLTLSKNVDQKSLETEFWTAICRQIGDKLQSKTLFLASFIRIRRLLKAFSIVAYLECYRVRAMRMLKPLNAFSKKMSQLAKHFCLSITAQSRANTWPVQYMAIDARKPVFGVCDQQVSYHNLLLAKFLASIRCRGDCFEPGFVRNPDYRFCRAESQILKTIKGLSSCPFKGSNSVAVYLLFDAAPSLCS